MHVTHQHKDIWTSEATTVHGMRDLMFTFNLVFHVLGKGDASHCDILHFAGGGKTFTGDEHRYQC